MNTGSIYQQESSNAKLEFSCLDTEPFSITCTHKQIALQIEEGCITVREQQMKNGYVQPRVHVSEGLKYMENWLRTGNLYIRSNKGYKFSYMTSPAQDIRWFMSMLLENERTTPSIDVLKPDTYNLNLLHT